ncbi:MAG TPA: deoxyribonuclease IV [Longimicrobiales bacterium]|nr:deoxyribonuclease IV [Longimicrobiales bacterium]
MDYIFGTHPVDNGGIHMAVHRAANAGLNTLQLFTAIPKFYGDRSSINPKRVERFREALAATGMRGKHVVVHAAYVLSVATAEPDKWQRAAAGLAKEMERSTALGVGGVCFHPGSASDGDPLAAAERVARAMTQALRSVTGTTRLLVENTAGAGRTIGRTAAEVGAILAHLPAELRSRAGYGLDTCHLFASGYDIHTSALRFTEIIDEFEQATGEPPAFFHLNDSEGALGSNRDRHMLLGEGGIGVEPFRWLLADRRARGVPLILETAQLNMDVAEDDPSGDPNDIRMAELLHRLAV